MMCSVILLTAFLGQTDARQMMEEMNAENGADHEGDTRSMMRGLNRDIARQALDAQRMEKQQPQPRPPVDNPPRKGKARAMVAHPQAKTASDQSGTRGADQEESRLLTDLHQERSDSKPFWA